MRVLFSLTPTCPRSLEALLSLVLGEAASPRGCGGAGLPVWRLQVRRHQSDETKRRAARCLSSALEDDKCCTVSGQYVSVM